MPPQAAWSGWLATSWGFQGIAVPWGSKLARVRSCFYTLKGPLSWLSVFVGQAATIFSLLQDVCRSITLFPRKLGEDETGSGSLLLPSQSWLLRKEPSRWSLQELLQYYIIYCIIFYYYIFGIYYIVYYFLYSEFENVQEYKDSDADALSKLCSLSAVSCEEELLAASRFGPKHSS